MLFKVQDNVTLTELYGSLAERGLGVSPRVREEAQRCGLAKVVFRTSNHIVDQGLEAMAAVFGGGNGLPTIGGVPISPVNITDANGHLMRITAEPSPTAPNDGDTALEGATIKSGTVDDLLLVVTYPALGKVNFQMVVQQLELVGTTITEEGLFTKNGLLLARTTFSKVKTDAFALQLDHEFTFMRV